MKMKQGKKIDDHEIKRERKRMMIQMIKIEKKEKSRFSIDLSLIKIIKCLNYDNKIAEIIMSGRKK